MARTTVTALPRHVRRPRDPSLTVAFRLTADEARLLAQIAENRGRPGDLHGTARELLRNAFAGIALAQAATQGDLSPEVRQQARDMLHVLASAFGEVPPAAESETAAAGKVA